MTIEKRVARLESTMPSGPAGRAQELNDSWVRTALSWLTTRELCALRCLSSGGPDDVHRDTWNAPIATQEEQNRAGQLWTRLYQAQSQGKALDAALVAALRKEVGGET